jgi:hypothetical protein
MNGLNIREVPGGKLLTFCCLLGFLCLSSVRSSAQSLQSSPATESLNWKAPQDAVALLLSQVQTLNQQLPGLSEGTPLHDNALRRVAYFKAIISEIGRGATVAESLDLSLPAAATLGFSREASATSKIALRALHTETRVLLTN